MKWTLLIIATTTMIVVAPPSSAQPAGRIAIFVGPQTRHGFIDVDEGVIDSIKDIENEFRRSNIFTMARTPDDATLVLLVVGRRIAGQSGSIGVPIGTMTMFLPVKRRAIDTILRVGSYERAMTSEDENSDIWRGSAKQVVKDVTAWVVANRSALKLTAAQQK